MALLRKCHVLCPLLGVRGTTLSIRHYTSLISVNLKVKFLLKYASQTITIIHGARTISAAGYVWKRLNCIMEINCLNARTSLQG